MNTFKSRTLVAALLLLTLVLTACSAPQTSPDPLATVSTTQAPAPLLSVRANGETIAAHELFLSALSWSGRGWLAADGAPAEHHLPTVAASLPTITMADDFSLEYRDNCSFYFMRVYNEAYERILPELTEPEALKTLQAGTYYISIVVKLQGDYIETEKKYESSTYSCVFKLSVA